MTEETRRQEEDRIKMIEYLGSKIAEFLKQNGIDPIIAYEVIYELELVMAEDCRAKGYRVTDLETHKQIAEMNFKAEKESIMRKEDEEL